MGKLWPADSIARNTSTTPLSNVVSIDESPLLEGLLYVGTDDGLIQVTEDGEVMAVLGPGIARHQRHDRFHGAVPFSRSPTT